jgi:outer membrane protein
MAMASVQARDCMVRGGVHNVDPKSNNNAIVSVASAATLTINGSCFVTPNVAIDVLGALPFKHDINLVSNGAKVASTQHLPPTFSVQYHFAPSAKFDPYVAVGLNYTLFFNKKTTGALAGTRLSLGNSVGVAAQVGGDFALSKDWVLSVDARWMDIDTNAKVNGASIGSVAIDPLAYGIAIGRRLSF